MNRPNKIDGTCPFRLTLLSRHKPLGAHVLPCLSMAGVTVTQVCDILPWSAPYPDAFILFADDYPSPEMIGFMRRKLSRGTVRAIALVTVQPREFDQLSSLDEYVGRLFLLPQLVWGCDVLDLIFALS